MLCQLEWTMVYNTHCILYSVLYYTPSYKTRNHKKGCPPGRQNFLSSNPGRPQHKISLRNKNSFVNVFYFLRLKIYFFSIKLYPENNLKGCCNVKSDTVNGVWYGRTRQPRLDKWLEHQITTSGETQTSGACDFLCCVITCVNEHILCELRH